MSPLSAQVTTDNHTGRNHECVIKREVDLSGRGACPHLLFDATADEKRFRTNLHFQRHKETNTRFLFVLVEASGVTDLLI